MRQTKFSLVIISAAFVQCNSVNSFEEVDHVPLSEYNYSKAIIEKGTELRLLAFGGSNQNDEKNIYYSQFLTLNEKTGDTLMILVPLISIESNEEAGKTHMNVHEFDPNKEITVAYYYPTDENTNLLLQSSSLTRDGEVDTTVTVQSLMDKIHLNQIVVVNKEMPEFERKFKTAEGVLHFKQSPL